MSASRPVAASHTLTSPGPFVKSPLAEEIRDPSGLNATLLTPPVCPLSVNIARPVTVSHTFTVWSAPEEAIRDPSRLNATPLIRPECPLRVSVSREVATSHTLTVASRLSSSVTEPSWLYVTALLAAAIREPSGLNDTLVMRPVRPLIVIASRPVVVSQTFTDLSTPDARSEPSGLNATPSGGWEIPSILSVSRPVTGVPHSHRLVGAGGGDARAIGAEAHARNRAPMTRVRSCYPARGRVPNLDHEIRTGGSDPRAVWAERDTQKGRIPFECLMTRRDLAPPVIPLKAAAIDTFLVRRTLLVETAEEQRRIPVLPCSLHHVHLHFVQATFGQLCFVLGDLGLNLGVDPRGDRLAPLPEHTAEPERRHKGDKPQQCSDRRSALRPLDGSFGSRHRPRHDRLVRQVSPQVVGQGRRRRIALLRFLLQAFQADRLQVAWNRAY